MKKLSFKEYYDSKITLITETSKPVIFVTSHNLNKYCKIPFTLNESKTYIAFKPKDNIIIEWSRSGDIITATKITINTTTYAPSWNGQKFKKWVETSSTQLFNVL